MIKKLKPEIIIVILFFIFYTLQVFVNHYFFRSNALDYGYYSQVFWKLAHFAKPSSTVTLSILDNFLQVHPSFTLYVLAPFYWIFQPLFGTYSLLIIQNIFIVIGGYYTFKLVELVSNSRKLGLLAILHYFIIWGHFSAIAFEYIDATVASSLMPTFFYFVYRRRLLWAGLVFLFVIIARENMPIWFIFVSIFIFISNIRERSLVRFSIFILIFSLGYLVFIYSIVIPHYEDPSLPYWGFAYSALGNSIPEALKFVFSHPIEACKLLFVNHSGDPAFDGIKMEFYWVFILTGGLMLILRPAYLLLFIPIIAQKMFNDNHLRWGINVFYSIEVVSILPLSVYLVLSDLSKKIKFSFWLGLIIIVSTMLVTVVKMNTRKAALYVKEKEKIYDPLFYKKPFDVRKINNYLKVIPPVAKVCATQNLVPHMAFRDTISIFPYVRNAEFLLFLDSKNTYPISKLEFMQIKNSYLTNRDWYIYIDDYPLLVLHKPSANIPKRTPIINSSQIEIGCDMETVTQNGELLSKDGKYILSGGQNISDSIAFSGLASLGLTPGSPYGPTLTIDSVKSGTLIQITGWRSKGANVVLAFSSANSAEYYISSDFVVDSTQPHWEKLLLEGQIPSNFDNEDFKVYCQSFDSNAVFVDDLNIKLISGSNK